MFHAIFHDVFHDVIHDASHAVAGQGVRGGCRWIDFSVVDCRTFDVMVVQVCLAFTNIDDFLWNAFFHVNLLPVLGP